MDDTPHHRAKIASFPKGLRRYRGGSVLLAAAMRAFTSGARADWPQRPGAIGSIPALSGGMLSGGVLSGGVLSGGGLRLINPPPGGPTLAIPVAPPRLQQAAGVPAGLPPGLTPGLQYRRAIRVAEQAAHIPDQLMAGRAPGSRSGAAGVITDGSGIPC
jgi:hypothetical protein